MQSFLEQFAQQISKLDKDELRDTLIIIPNRRAKLYLTKHLAQKIDKPIWAPQIFAINDFVFSQIKMKETNPIELIVKLYEVHKKLEKRNPQSLDQFSSWAELLLSDFNEIDLYLAPIERLFSYLSDAKRIESWELDPDKLTPQEKNYLKFYESLSQYYFEFQKLLIQENKAYQGMAFRLFSEKLSDIKLDFKRIYIVGFNALSPSESSIIEQFKQDYKTEVIWDIDDFYFDNKQHEAGYFLRKQLAHEERSKIKNIHNYWKTSNKNINIYGLDGNIGQVKYAAQLLQNKLQNGEYLEAETAVILANEELMIPMINSIPEQVNKFNLTMSYPLRLHAGYDLISRVFNLFSEYNFKDTDSQSVNFYHQHFTSFINHPFIQKYLILDGNNLTQEIENYIKSNNLYRINFNHDFLIKLEKANPHLQKLISILKQDNYQVINILGILIDLFKELSSDEIFEHELHFISHYIEVLQQLMDTLSGFGEIERLGTLKRWVQNSINQSPIPFTGEPLAGLQMMGMLETRTLDFKNIIILSVNEGVLPKTKAYQSFILYDIKKEFNLPLPIENDAITAYHFYRLLQRSKEVNLIYSRSSTGMQSNEPSRFIKQIELEIPDINPAIKIAHHLITFPVQQEEKAKEIIIQKTDDIIQRLIEIGLKGFSPSSLNNYKKCGYYFYLQRIVRLKKDDEVEEQMAYNTQGNILHETLEDIFKPFIGKEISRDEFVNCTKNAQNIFIEKLAKTFGKQNTEQGRNYLTRKILEQYLENFIKKESLFLKENPHCKIVGVEQILEKKVNYTINNQVFEFIFKGSADRIDQNKSQIRIVDYKTGSVTESTLQITESKTADQWNKMFSDEYDKAFQLMMYAWMYWDQKPNYTSLSSGISALKNHSDFYPLKLYNQDVISPDHIKRFELDLEVLVSEIFDTEIPFSQRKYDKVCEYCDYKLICMRQ